MNRVPKFRFWNSRLNIMDNDPDYNSVSHKINDSFSDPLDEGVWLQFTGSEDEAGVPIFEGDIWQREGFIATVEFQYSHWSLVKAESSDCYQYPSFYSNAPTGIVIGNIYQNPELIKGE